MRTKPTSQKKAIPAILIILILLAAACTAFFVYRKFTSLEAKRYDMSRLTQESYDSVFFSMHPLHNYDAEDFPHYYAWDTILSTYSIPHLREMAQYLNTAFRSGNSLKNICLGIDPYKIWSSSGKKDSRWEQALDKYLLNFIEENPLISYYIILPGPSLEYWLSLNSESMEEILDSYRRLVVRLDAYDNVFTYFCGAKQWIIANPANYEDAFTTTPFVSHTVLLNTIYKTDFLITAGTADDILGSLLQLADRERTSPTEYPDFSDMHFVFFGDSVIGNYKGSLSIPGVTGGLSGASVYNYAIGGTHAASISWEDSFPDVVERFLQGTLPPSQDSQAFPFSAENIGSENICFLIHYGLNDYFNGSPIYNPDDPFDINTFTGALRFGINKLREAYPDAAVLLMTPPFCSYFSFGTEINGDMGGSLTDYVDAVIETAQAENALYMNDYIGLGINEENWPDYIPDGCHLNETGRFLLGSQIVFALKDAFSAEAN